MTSLEAAEAAGLEDSASPRGGRAGRAKLINLLLLIGSFGAGQGAIFAVQTALIAYGRVDLIASFGTCFSFAILCILLIDFGSQTTIARETAIAVRSPDERTALWAAYWNATLVRAILGIVVVALAAGYALLTTNAFERWYVLCALPAALVWPFNATGVLDGLRMSGVAGVVGSAPYVVSAAALAFAINLDTATAGAVLGGALSIGYLASVIAQFTALSSTGHPLTVVKPTAKGIRRAAVEGGSVFLAMAPGQLYFRYQLLLATIFLGPHGTAMFVYAKQIVTAFAQVIAFMRRVEFPDLVRRLGGPRQAPIREAMQAQALGTALGGAGTILMLVAGLVLAGWLSGTAAEAAFSAAVMAPTVVAGAIAAALSQALQAMGQFRSAAIAVITATIVGAVVNAGTAFFPSVWVFAASDLALSAVMGAASLILLRMNANGARHG